MAYGLWPFFLFPRDPLPLPPVLKVPTFGTQKRSNQLQEGLGMFSSGHRALVASGVMSLAGTVSSGQVLQRAIGLATNERAFDADDFFAYLGLFAQGC